MAHEDGGACDDGAGKGCLGQGKLFTASAGDFPSLAAEKGGKGGGGKRCGASPIARGLAGGQGVRSEVLEDGGVSWGAARALDQLGLGFPIWNPNTYTYIR